LRRAYPDNKKPAEAGLKSADQMIVKAGGTSLML
jgi:hypothetical protein